jgi:hypothetical protein
VKNNYKNVTALFSFMYIFHIAKLSAGAGEKLENEESKKKNLARKRKK